MIYAAIAIAVLLIALFVLVWRLSGILLHPKRAVLAHSIELEIERGNFHDGEIEALPHEDFSVTAFDGTLLQCSRMYTDYGDGKHSVVLVHGFGSRRAHMLKYAVRYLRHGYDVLLFDHRNSGASGGKMTTMGYVERHDVMQMVENERKRLGDGAVVGVHGESMGGGTVVMCACLDNAPDFVIADCPYWDMYGEIRYCVKQRAEHIPIVGLIMAAGSLVIKLRAGFFAKEVSPICELEKCGGAPNVPMMFFHGEEDTFVPCESSRKLYAVKQGKKDIMTVPKAIHARSITAAPKEYEEKLFGFLKECGYTVND